MLKLNWKNAIIAGAVLTAICTTAFAQEAAKPTMKERVNAILSEKDSTCPPDGPLFDGGRRRAPGLERNAEYFRHHHHGITKEEWDAKTPEEKRQLREQWRKDWECKSPEERQQLRQKWEQERLERMTPEQRERFEERQRIRIQRDAERKERAQEKMDKLSPEQRADVEDFLKDDMENRNEMRNRMKDMTPEQRDAIRANRGPASRAYHAGHHGYRHHSHHRADCWW